MKLIRFGGPGKERPGLLLSDGTRIVTSGFRPNGVFAYDEEFFAAMASRNCASGSLPM